MSKLKIETVKRNPNDLKQDPNQPRKKFDQDSINHLAQTMKSQGVINPIEIDENDVIVTGEMRWRASKKARLTDIECKQITGLSEIDRFERQTVENLHHNVLTSKEKEDAVKKLFESGKYKTKEELGDILGLKQTVIYRILRAYNTRKELEKEKIPSGEISTKTLDYIGTLKSKEDRKKIAEKVVKKEIKPSEVSETVKVIKEIGKKAPEIKEKLLKSDTKITEEKLEEAKEVAKLPKDIRKEVLKSGSKFKVEDAKKIAKLPEGLKKEVLKPKSEITIKDAEDIAEIKPELRKEAIKVVKKQKQRQQQEKKQTMEYMKDVSKGETKPPQKVIDLDMKIINQFSQIYKQVIIKMTKRLVESYNQQTQNRLLRIMRETLIHLQKELKIKGEIIDVT